MSDVERAVIDAARAYRLAELNGTPRMWRGKDLQALATVLDEALEALEALEAHSISDE